MLFSFSVPPENKEYYNVLLIVRLEDYFTRRRQKCHTNMNLGEIVSYCGMWITRGSYANIKLFQTYHSL